MPFHTSFAACSCDRPHQFESPNKPVRQQSVAGLCVYDFCLGPAPHVEATDEPPAASGYNSATVTMPNLISGIRAADSYHMHCMSCRFAAFAGAGIRQQAERPATADNSPPVSQALSRTARPPQFGDTTHGFKLPSRCLLHAALSIVDPKKGPRGISSWRDRFCIPSLLRTAVHANYKCRA